MDKKDNNKELNLDDIVQRAVLQKLERYIHGKINSHILKTHFDMINKKNKKKVNEGTRNFVSEEAPTNVMGTSSSTSGTGNIDTFDPLLFSGLIKRKPPANIKFENLIKYIKKRER